MYSLSSYCNNSRKNILENHVCLCQTQGTSAPGVAGPRSCFPCVPVCESSPAPRLAPVVCWVLPSASCPREGTPLSFSVPVTAVPAGGSLWCVLSCSALALPQLSSQPRGDNLPLVLLGVTGLGGQDRFVRDCWRAPCSEDWDCWWPGLDAWRTLCSHDVLQLFTFS